MKKLINEPIDVIESFFKEADDVLAGDFFKLLREGRGEVGFVPVFCDITEQRASS